MGKYGLTSDSWCYSLCLRKIIVVWIVAAVLKKGLIESLALKDIYSQLCNVFNKCSQVHL